jgi:hypothetical protein
MELPQRGERVSVPVGPDVIGPVSARRVTHVRRVPAFRAAELDAQRRRRYRDARHLPGCGGVSGGGR